MIHRKQTCLPLVDPELRQAGPNGLGFTRFAAVEALVPGLNLRPDPQITETCKQPYNPLSLVDFKY
jgi:hypothetical protein